METSVIERFYTAFKNKDFHTMQVLYADDVVFSDPVFTNLEADKVRSMWEMFCTQSKDLNISYTTPELIGLEIITEWTATYSFGRNKRPVRNHIKARFHLQNGKISHHTDNFNFYNWSKQAFGLTGWLFGWTPFFRNKVSKSAMGALLKYMNKKSA